MGSRSARRPTCCGAVPALLAAARARRRRSRSSPTGCSGRCSRWWLLVVAAAPAAAAPRAVRPTAARSLLLAVAAVVIAVNWGTYIWGVNNGQVVETSLGYFINPLVTVLMGVLILGERLRPLQWVAHRASPRSPWSADRRLGRPPWVALVLAFSFGTYGLAKKQANVGAVESLAFETMVLAPFALGYLVLAGRHGQVQLRLARRRPRAAAVRDRHRDRHPADLLRRGRDPGLDDDAGAAAVPRADHPVRARRPLLPRGHAAGRWVGFVLVWVALVIFTYEANAHRRRQLRADGTGLGRLTRGRHQDRGDASTIVMTSGACQIPSTGAECGTPVHSQ